MTLNPWSHMSVKPALYDIDTDLMVDLATSCELLLGIQSAFQLYFIKR